MLIFRPTRYRHSQPGAALLAGGRRAPAGYARPAALALALLLSLLFMPPALARTVTVGLPDNPPITFTDEGGRPRGLAVDFLESVAAGEGWQLQYVQGPWQQLLQQVASDRLDLLPGTAYTAERAGQMDFTATALVNNWGVVVAPADARPGSLLDLQGLRVAVVASSVHTLSFNQLWQRFGIALELVERPDYPAVFDAVHRGEADVGVVSRISSLSLAAGSGLSQTGIIFNPVSVRFASRTGLGLELVEVLDRALVAQIDEPGSAYQRAVERWLTVQPQRRGSPGWLPWLVGAAVSGLLLSLLFNWMLQTRVRIRTRSLRANAAVLQEEVHRRQVVEERLRGLLEASPDLIFRVDEHGRFHDVLTAADNLLVLPRESVVGRRIEELLPRDVATRAMHQIGAALETGQPQTFQYELNVIDGQRWFEARLARIERGAAAERSVIIIARDITEFVRAQAAVRDSEDRFRTLAEVAPVGIFIADADGRCQYVNDRWCAITGVARESALGTHWTSSVHPADAQTVMSQWEALRASRRELAVDCRLARADGATVWISASAAPLLDESGELLSVIGSLTDVTELKAAELRQRQSSVFFENTADALVIADAAGRILMTNPAFASITGYTENEVRGRPLTLLRSRHHGRRFYRELIEAVRHSGRWEGEIWIATRTGMPAPQWLSTSVVRDDNGRLLNYVAAFSDIRALKDSEARLARLAHHDPLTDLPNRMLLNERLHRSIQVAGRAGHKLAVLFLDLDRFKNINDSLGHPVGDEVLRVIASRLPEELREIDTVARLGGDEFVVLLEQMRSKEDIQQLSRKLLDRVGQPIQVGERELYVTTSIGISLFPDDGEEVAELIRNADTAMYVAKAGGRNTFRFYRREQTEGALRRVEIESELREALDKDQLEVHYQPQVQFDSGAIVGAEALLRWRHPREGLLPPGRFLPIAEEAGLTRPLGAWVLRRVCRQVREWLDAGQAVPRVAVNLSAEELQRPGLVEEVRAVLAETGCPPSHLELEMTEGSIMRRADSTSLTLGRLRDLGLSIAIDDFGTGYSSLSYLKSFPIQILKIDQSFVRDLAWDPNDEAIAVAILALARSLDMDVIAEGVETIEQRDALMAHGCCYGQGYLFARPMPADAFVAYCRNLVAGDSARALRDA